MLCGTPTTQWRTPTTLWSTPRGGAVGCTLVKTLEKPFCSVRTLSADPSQLEHECCTPEQLDYAARGRVCSTPSTLCATPGTLCGTPSTMSVAPLCCTGTGV